MLIVSAGMLVPVQNVREICRLYEQTALAS